MPEHPTHFQNLDVSADRRGSFADIWRFRQSARQQAEATLGLDKMVDEYLKVLLG